MSGKFEIYKGTDTQYYFRLLAQDGGKLGRSEGYTSKSGATNGINSVKANATTSQNFTVLKGTDGNYYFNLKAQNNEIILQSSYRYTTQVGANAGVAQVIQAAPNATISDQT